MKHSDIEIVIAECAQTREIHYSIRYQAYCLDYGYEDPDQFPDGQEYDDYDEHAVHIIARSHSTGEPMGACRLVTGELGELPVTSVSAINDAGLLGLPGPTMEISRLCVLKDCAEGDSARQTAVMMGLLHAARRWGLRHGMRRSVLLAQVGLQRLLRRFGITIHQVGEVCNHRGKRAPFVFDLVSDLEAGVATLWAPHYSPYDPNVDHTLTGSIQALMHAHTVDQGGTSSRRLASLIEFRPQAKLALAAEAG